MTQSIGKNLILLVSVVVLLVVGAVVYYQKGRGPGATLPSQEIGERVVNYINQNIPGSQVSLIDITEDSGLYKLILRLDEGEFVFYATKDGKLFFPQAINMEETSQVEQEEVVQETPRNAVPDIKLFVMSYCPFGLQAEKALLPAWKLLEDKAKIGIYFVDYAMHEKKEIDENLRQYCIQKEQPEKIISYLECFVKDGDYEGCLSKAGIDRGRLAGCMETADKEFNITKNYEDRGSWFNGRFPKFEVHAGLNKEYGVSGSPTLVINGTVVKVSQRSPEVLKAAICEAFVETPKECSQKLSEKNASPGFGEGAGSSSGGTCE